MTDSPNRSTTPRGFAVYDEVPTRYGHTVTVQMSSSAEEPCVWLFIGDSDVAEGHDPHMTVDQARRVRDALTAFIDEEGGDGVTVCKCGQILCICKDK